MADPPGDPLTSYTYTIMVAGADANAHRVRYINGAVHPH